MDPGWGKLNQRWDFFSGGRRLKRHSGRQRILRSMATLGHAPDRRGSGAALGLRVGVLPPYLAASLGHSGDPGGAWGSELAELFELDR